MTICLSFAESRAGEPGEIGEVYKTKFAHQHDHRMFVITRLSRWWEPQLQTP